MLGKRVLGAEGAAAEREKSGQPGMVVAVKLGKRVLPVVQKAGKMKAGSRVRVQESKPVAKPAPKKVAFTEDEVQHLLEVDPDQWSAIVDAESKRPDGPRPAVAAIILGFVSETKANPIPEAIITELERIAKVKE